ncbi:hypothetical protein FOZ63_009888 [Perkinsus olseni]|uniref:Uncharacterized protein n=1 Tax=Perkinsus olseni TaxID=32597 RepID=A0A7J6RPA3_PEROL|nr:hypothetical protein FOZ62_029143 [Perkinsus olseni]KAF4725421.1 hypothetical protein FOZ63_009888 [Perkinsus olseni]
MLPSSAIYDQVAELERAVDSVPLAERPRKPPQPASRSGGTSALAQAVSRHSIKLGLNKPRPSVDDASMFGSYSVGHKTSLVGSSSPPRPLSEKRSLYMSRTTKMEATPSASMDPWSMVKSSRPPEDSEEAKAVLLAGLLCDVRAHNRRRDRLAQEELMIRSRLARLTQLGCTVEEVERELRKDQHQQPPRSEHPSLWLREGSSDNNREASKNPATELPGQEKPVYLQAARKYSGDVAERMDIEVAAPQVVPPLTMFAAQSCLRKEVAGYELRILLWRPDRSRVGGGADVGTVLSLMPSVSPERRLDVAPLPSRGSTRGGTTISEDTQDELAMDEGRWSLFDAMQHLTTVKPGHHSRALMVLSYPDVGSEAERLVQKFREGFVQWLEARRQVKARRVEEGQEPESLSHLDEYGALSGFVVPCVYKTTTGGVRYWIVLLLEGPNPGLARAAEWAEGSSPEAPDGGRAKVSVLMFSELRTTQLLKGLHFCCMQPLEGPPLTGEDKNALADEAHEQDKAASALWITYRDLVTLVHEASEAASPSPSPTDLYSYVTKNLDLLPSPESMEIIDTLADQYILSAREFVGLLLGAPAGVKLESDLTWPMAPRLAY